MTELCALTRRGSLRLQPLLLLLGRSYAAGLTSQAGSGGSARRAEADLTTLAHGGALSGAPAKLLAATLLQAGAKAAGEAGSGAEGVVARCTALLRCGCGAAGVR